MNFSLVTTCYNEIQSVENWINDIKNQTIAPDEIVIVDAKSSDGTLGILNDWASTDDRIKIIVEKSTPSQGRNLAIKNTSHEYIVSTDMGCRLDEFWFQHMIEPFLTDRLTNVVAGKFTIDETKITTLAGWADFTFYGNIPIAKFKDYLLPSNRSVAYKKKIWENMGGYPEDITFAGDDAVFGLQLNLNGISITYTEKAVCYWLRPEKFSEFWKERERYGFADGETNFLISNLSKYAFKFWFPLYLYPYLFMSIIKRIPRILKKMIERRKLLLLLATPLLVFGNGFYYWRAYRKGFNKGRVSAINCRKRINTNI